MKPFVFLLLLFAPYLCNGQFVEKQLVRIPTAAIKANHQYPITIRSDHSISSVALKTSPTADFGSTFLIADRDTFPVTLNEDAENDKNRVSNLIIFKNPVREIYLIPGLLKDSAEVYLIRADLANFPANTLIQNGNRLKKSGSDLMPAMIDQSIWRQGLPEPEYERILNIVRNVIVHHSATANSVTDYTSAIRNIYLYHTQVNHWSDIGYNYIVAPNGDIYKGRDPGSFLQDEVLGAHFCSSNTGTLGICVLGTYSDAYPTDTSMRSLEKLVIWKLAKDHLNPLGVTPHPLNPDLDVIAGHRNGCATFCPGDSLYTDLGILRNHVHEAMILLGTGEFDYFTSTAGDEPTFRIYPNPATDQLSVESAADIKKILLMDAYGRILSIREGEIRQLDIRNLTSGWYQIVFVLTNRVVSHKIFKF